MIVLGCITNNLSSAIKLAALLSRSLVQVNIRTALPNATSPSNNVAPFEILVQSASNNESPQSSDLDAIKLPLAVAWLKAHKTYRYWYVTDDTHSHNTSNKLFDNVDSVLRSLSNSGINTACHVRLLDNDTFKRCYTTSDKTRNAMQCGTVRMTQGESRFKDLVSSIDLLEASFESTLRHLIIKRPPQLNRENVSSIDWMTAIRGAERYGLVVGPPAAGEHLPAMLRIRGWLNSSHQTTRIDLIADHPTLVVNDQTNEHPQKADWIQYSDVINGLADDLLDRVTLVTRHKDGLASVSVLQKTHLEQGLLSVTAAKIDNNHPLRTHFSIE